jgi:hypothetical protein
MPHGSSILARICLTNFWCAVSVEVAASSRRRDGHAGEGGVPGLGTIHERWSYANCAPCEKLVPSAAQQSGRVK